MSGLENSAQWPEILALKDELPLKDLAARFGTTPGALSAALKRTGTARVATGPEGEELPPEPGEDPSHEAAIQRARLAIRGGSKDALIAEHLDLLGRRPDADVARLAGVSVRTIASFRARHEIPGYRGPRRVAGARGPRRSRIDPYLHLLGAVPDRVVSEQAGVSLNAVRNYRVKRGISASGRRVAGEGAPPPAPVPAHAAPTGTAGARRAWSIQWRVGAASHRAALLATDLGEACRMALAAGLPGEVVEVSLVGELLAAAP